MRVIREFRYAQVKEAYNAQWAATRLQDNHRRIIGDQSVVEIEGYLRKHPAVRILDLGCGMGRTVEHFARKGFAVVGMDIAIEGLRLYKEYRPEAKLVCGSVVDLPFRGQTFDLILLMGVLYEIESLEEMRRMLESMKHLLRQGGRLIYVSQYPKDLWKTILSYVPFHRRWFRRLFMRDKVDSVPYFSRYVMSNVEVVALFARSGWRLEALKPVNQYYGAANWFYDLFFKKKGERPLSFEVEENPQEFVRFPGRLVAAFSQRFFPMLSAGLVYFQFAPEG